MEELEVDVLLDWKPLGQRVIEHGYSLICIDEIKRRLNMKEMLKRSFNYRLTQLKKEKANIKIASLRDNEYCIMQQYPFKSYSVGIELRYENIETYFLIIPEKALNEIRKAKNIGLEEFNIYYAVLDNKRQNDPIITAKFGKHELFITQY